MRSKSRKSIFGSLFHKSRRLQTGTGNVKGCQKSGSLAADSEGIFVIESVKTGKVLFSVST